MDQKDKDKILDSIKEVGQRKFLTSSMRSQKETSNKTGLPISWVSALFKKFQAIYLHKWTSAIEGIEDLAVVEWSQGLSGLSGEQIKLGIANLSEDWPPSVIAFRALCEGKRANGLGLDYAPPYHSQVKRDKTLDSDENKEKRRKAHSVGMGNIRDILGKD
jgi:hypothetical protein